MNNPIPLDIASIYKIGIEDWSKNTFWPMGQNEFDDIVEFLWSEFDLLIMSLSRRDQKILIADSKFVSLLSDYIHLTVSKKIIKEHKTYDYVYSDIATKILFPNFKDIASKYRFSYDAKVNLFLKFKSFIKNICFNKFQYFFSSPDVWVLGSNDKLKTNFIEENNYFVRYKYFQNLIKFKNNHIQSLNLSQDLEEKKSIFFKNISGFILDKYKFEIDFKNFSEAWRSRLIDLSNIYISVYSSKFKPEKILLSEVGNPFHKIICSALHDKAVDIYGFGHGNDEGLIKRKINIYNEYTHCDFYICYSKRSTYLKNQEYDESPLSKSMPTNFIFLDSHSKSEILDYEINKEINTIMVIGYPFSHQRFHFSVADYFFHQLALEIKVAKFIKNLGKRVIYKPHPSLPSIYLKNYIDIFDEVLTTPFESCYQRADALFFSCITTTTFGFSLQTKLPIIFLDYEKQNYAYGIHSFLKSRCELIPASYDKNNLIEFDHSYFEGVITKQDNL